MREFPRRVAGSYRTALALVVATALCLGTPVWGSDEGDFEYWSKASFLIPIQESWRFKFDQKFSFPDEARRLENHQQDFGVIYSGLADWIDLGFSVKQKFEKYGDDWERETRPHFNVKVNSTLFGWGLSNRTRLAYRDVENDDAVWRWRHKIALKSPVTFTPWKIQPYFAEEIFVQLDDEDFNANRVSTGLYIPLHEKIRLELFYAWHIDEEPDCWHDTNLLASFLRLTF